MGLPSTPMADVEFITRFNHLIDAGIDPDDHQRIILS